MLDGEVKTTTITTKYGTPRSFTYVENLVMTIKTNNQSFNIYSPSPKLKRVKDFLDEMAILRQQILFYKSYFWDKFEVAFDCDGKVESSLLAYELETGDTLKSTNCWDIILNIILISVVLYYLFKMLYIHFSL